MNKTTKIYSAPTLLAVGSVVARTLGEPTGIVLESAPSDPRPYFKMDI
jgi:hypothetical protein